MARPWTPPQKPNGWDYRPPSTSPAATTKPKAAPSKVRPLAVSSPGDLGPAKVKLLLEKVTQPALRTNLGWTRGILAEALRGAPGGTNGHDKRAMAARIFEYVRFRLRYVNDPKGRELYTALPVLWTRGIGDCDDFAALLAALFQAAGIPTKLRVIRGKNAKAWSHIYPVALVGSRTQAARWTAYDATENKPAGWEAPRVAFFDTEVKP